MRKLIGILLVIISIIPMTMSAQTYENLWKQVKQAEEKSLPQSAINITEKIFNKATKEGNSPQMLLAYTRQMRYKTSINPDTFYTAVQQMEVMAERTTDPVDRQVVQSLLAAIYAEFANENQWQLKQRTSVMDDPSPDMREWGGNQFIDKVTEKVQLSVNDSAKLLSVSSKTYIPFVISGETSTYFDHTMYHLLAKRSIDALELIENLDSDSTVIKRIDSIYNNLIKLYQQQNNIDALILTELDFLNRKLKLNSDISYLARREVAVDRNDWFLKALDELIDKYGNREVITEVYLAKIQYLIRVGNNVSALNTADRAITLFPDYKRINAVKEFRQSILRPEIRVYSAAMVYPDSPFDLRVTHRNIDNFTVELYRVNLPVTAPELLKTLNEDFAKRHTTRLNKRTLAVERPADYLIKDTVLNMTAPGEGLYLMRITAPNEDYHHNYKLLSVTRLKLLTQRLPGNKLEMVTLDAMSGKPVERATINLYENRRGEKILADTVMTGTDGKVTIPVKENYQYVNVIKEGDSSMTINPLQRSYYYYNENDRSRRRMTLLTDRSIYRPGQTVYVKGVVYDQQDGEANVVPNAKYTLNLFDSNGRELGKKELTTNDFGSFTAEFILPSGGLNGMYSLRTELTSQSIRVEEYKRPTFDITFTPLEGTYRTGDHIEVQGTVKTFSGVPVQDIPAQYTISRRMRNWWSWWIGESMIIDSGSVSLNANGEFNLPVTLAADPKNKDDGFYIYTVEVTVTNVAGETQSSTVSISAGDRSVLLNIEIADRINKDDSIKATFIASNLNDRPVDLTGEYKLYHYKDFVNKTVESQPAFTGTFTANSETLLPEWKSIPSGGYKLVMTALDQQGREATFEKDIVLFSIRDTSPAVPEKIWYYPIQTEFNAEQTASFVFGTSEQDAYVLMDVFYKNKRLESRILHLSDKVVQFTYPYQEEYGDGLSISFCFVKNNELYQQTVQLTRKQPEMKLQMNWEVFRDKLRPGQAEEWRLVIRNADGSPVNAEMMATMYDASLDKIWKMTQDFTVRYSRNLPSTGWNMPYWPSNYFNVYFRSDDLKYPAIQYDRFNVIIGSNGVYYAVAESADMAPGEGPIMIRGAASLNKVSRSLTGAVSGVLFESEVVSIENSGSGLLEDVDNLRTNFAETAFFYPQLRTNENGEVVLSFTMPESLTRWNFRGYAHTQDMKTGILIGETVTSKEFMLTPNLPRFVRVDDMTSIAASVANLTAKQVSGNVKLVLFDPLTDKVISTQKQKFTAGAGNTTAVEFMITPTDEYEMVGLRLIAEGGRFSDGEQHILPVLSKKEYIVETIAMPVRGNQSREFSLESLFNNHSRTATNRRLTVEFTGNPVWYAIQALPSLSMPDNDNAISWATAYYANSLASYILNTYPRLKSVMDSWRRSDDTKETWISNLQKNQELMNILIEESPWLAEAQSETEQMQRLSLLFDLNMIRNNNVSALNKLKDLQLVDGSWSWYKGMNGSGYTTGFVVESLSRLANITGEPLNEEILAMRNNGLSFIYGELIEYYRIALEQEKTSRNVTGISQSVLKSLYIAVLTGEPVPDNAKKAVNYFINKIPGSISKMSVTDKAMAAIVLNKSGKTSEAGSFVASLKEYLTRTDEQGAYFAFNASPYSWSGLQIPAHVTVMEALELTGNEQATIDDMKIWLLKQKQATQWNSPVASANAVYALLFTGSDWNVTEGDVKITLGNETVSTTGRNSIPALGYVKEVFTDKPVIDANTVKVEKSGDGIGWGAVYAQYMEDIDKVTQRGGELNVDKKFYVERLVNNVRQLEPLNGGETLSVGDKVVSRITIRLDRAMDFVQLKDQRAACLEPIDNLSGYRRGAATGYYVAIKDASTNYFFDSLNKGVYVLEHTYRVSRRGVYEGGLAVMQSAYAPEYSTHSDSMKLKVSK